jgi:hypothetical protein
MQSFAKCTDSCAPDCRDARVDDLGTIDDSAGSKIISEELKGRADRGYEPY